TGDPLTVAIEGQGFFEVQRADGKIALTRAGNFHIDANGSLVTANGERLVPPITLPKGADPSTLEIGADGTVTLSRQKIGTINVVDVTAPDGLQAAGDNLL